MCLIPTPLSSAVDGPLKGGFGAAGYAGAQPVVADGVVYVGSTRGTLYAFPASCRSPCQPLHEVRLPGVLNNPLVLVDGTLYVTSGHDLYAFATRCLDRMSCGPDWVGSASALILSPPAVGDGYVYVGSTDGAISAFPVACGRGGQTCRPAWTISDLGLLPNPSLVDGVLFVGSTWAEKELIAFDADCGASGATCSPLWTFVASDFGAFQQPTASDGNGTLFAVTGDPAGQGGAAGGRLYAFRVDADAASGQGSTTRAPAAPSIDLVTVSLLGLAAALSAIWWRRRARRGIQIEA